MTRLAFLLDSTACIGCHACTVACKSEHDVPIGVNRTWVKYIETGTFPDATRTFNVMRCNHCDDAPCIAICPTSALFRASNGVVDFDDANCIGCKACMNACPYDAIYIDPGTKTAQKCNFCNHRVEVGLEPACVVVCPTRAIGVADLDDPGDPVGRIIARDDVAVRSPEQGTRPKTYYRGADPVTLDPTRTAIASDGMIWAETTAAHRSVSPDEPGVVGRTAYNTAHPLTWGAMVSGYLVTKAIAAGLMLVAALLVVLGHAEDRSAVGVVPPFAAGAFLAVTGALLVADLKQPARFHFLLTRSNRTSWLVKGAYVLMVFSAACGLWLIAGIAGSATALQILVVPTVLAAAGTAGYTAFLFAQCEGRDLWQTRLLLPVLLAQAVAAGGASYSVMDLFTDVPQTTAIRWTMLAGLAAMAGIVTIELTAPAGRTVELARRAMTRGAHARQFWLGAVLAGIVAPAALVAVTLAAGLDGPLLPAAAGLSVLGGLFAYEDAFVRAGQAVPLS